MLAPRSFFHRKWLKFDSYTKNSYEQHVSSYTLCCEVHSHSSLKRSASRLYRRYEPNFVSMLERQMLRSFHFLARLTPRIEEMKHDAESRLKFLKMVTPRRPSKEAENKVYRYLFSRTTQGCSVDEKGEIVEGHGVCANEFAFWVGLICSARLSHFGMVTDEMRFINEQQMRRMHYLPYKKRI